MTVTIKAAITTRAIRVKETYEAEYDGVRQVSLYKIEILDGLQELRTYLTGDKVKQTDISGWAGLAEKMDELIDYYISPLLKDMRTT